MKLTDILHHDFSAQNWTERGYELPHYDVKALREKTHREPTWVHFGGQHFPRISGRRAA